MRGVAQVPRPSQVATVVSVPAVHEGAPHMVWSLGKVQLARFEPSQVPAHTPLPPQARRPAWGAPVTAVHAPSEPGTSHASHCPPQAVLQHTPSMQLPVAHSALVVQPMPAGMRVTHVPAWQRRPVEQSPSVEHRVRQAVGPHT